MSFIVRSFHFTTEQLAVTFNGTHVYGQESLILNLCYEVISNFL